MFWLILNQSDFCYLSLMHERQKATLSLLFQEIATVMLKLRPCVQNLDVLGEKYRVHSERRL